MKLKYIIFLLLISNNTFTCLTYIYSLSHWIKNYNHNHNPIFNKKNILTSIEFHFTEKNNDSSLFNNIVKKKEEKIIKQILSTSLYGLFSEAAIYSYHNKNNMYDYLIKKRKNDIKAYSLLLNYFLLKKLIYSKNKIDFSIKGNYIFGFFDSELHVFNSECVSINQARNTLYIEFIIDISNNNINFILPLDFYSTNKKEIIFKTLLPFKVNFLIQNKTFLMQTLQNKIKNLIHEE